MPEKSKVISIRFSLEEIETIKNYMKKYNLKSFHDVVRVSPGFMISMVESMMNIYTSDSMKAMEQFSEDIKKEFDKVPATKAKLRAKWQSLNRDYLPKLESEMKKRSKSAATFGKKRQAGRPKKPKRKRGKPKNRGYEK